MEHDGAGRSAIVIGGSGAIGTHLCRLLADRGWRVSNVGRRQYTEEELDMRVNQIVVDLNTLGAEEHAHVFAGHDAAFCTLGTTKADAGSAEAFRLVDFTYVTEFARQCGSAGIAHFSNVSSMDPKTKGQAEEFIKGLEWSRGLTIWRPGLLGRPNPRTAEKFFAYVSKAIPVKTVAKAMIVRAERCLEGDAAETVTLGNKDIYRLAKEFPAGEVEE